MSDFDIAIIGAGIAGASLAAELPPHLSVLLLEAEAYPGYHATGRSAAFWDECYGGAGVQPLTSASGRFLANPPADFADSPLLNPRGAFYIGTNAEMSFADAMLAEFADSGVKIERADRALVESKLCGARPEWTQGLWVPGCQDIDVGALHAGYLRQAKRQGVQLVCNAPLSGADWHEGHWRIQAGGRHYESNILINAAGAWADDVARIAAVAPVGITPYRRTIVQLTVDPAAPADLPLVIGLDGSFYFKPDSGGTLWLSPHDETVSAACDTAPEEIDIALAIDRLQQVVDWQIKRVEHKWAGLRSFAPDRLPVIGADPANPAFFWLAGQGGFGIQTAPAVAKLATAQLLDRPSPFAAVNPATYAAARFR